MCCLFGMIDYQNHFSKKQKNKIISILSVACEIRGTDATGIAYNQNNRLHIYKRPLEAHRMKFSIPDGVHTIMGHTRMTTQGNEKFNYNNHPFYGKTGETEFALAHNGVLHNDIILRKEENLPKTKIATDSYIAVQLLEEMKELNFESIRTMAEKLEGSFTMTIMDRQDNLYFIKGDNPMCIYHFPEIGVYLYASTEEILTKALQRIPYKFGKAEKVSLFYGDLLKINSLGEQSRSAFDTEKLFSYVFPPYPVSKKAVSFREEYIDLLKHECAYYGYSSEDIDALLCDGYTTDDIEEILTCGVF